MKLVARGIYKMGLVIYCGVILSRNWSLRAPGWSFCTEVPVKGKRLLKSLGYVGTIMTYGSIRW